MDEAGATRRAACEAVADIEPDGLHDRIRDLLESGSMAPGVLTIYTAGALSEDPPEPTESLGDPLCERAAGVQLIYDGLRLTRELAHEEPWAHGETDRGNLDVLVADVLVARGFHLLARTAAATKAVETVRAFGRDQTVQRETGESLDRNLEADALELAVIAGSTLSAAGVPGGLRTFAADRAGELDANGFPPADQFFGDLSLERLRHAARDGGSEGVVPSVDD